MQMNAWAVVAVLTVALVVVLVLWQRARLAVRAARQTLDEVNEAIASRSGAGLAEFPDNVIFRLLAKGQLNIGGRVQSFGVVQDDAGIAQPFLTTVGMEHLVGGNSFSSIRGRLHKVDAGTPAAPVTATMKASPAPATPPPVAASSVASEMAAALDASGDGDIGERTIMFAPSRQTTTASRVDPLSGFPVLKVTAGPDTGTSFPLPFTHATIGRDKSNIIPLGDNGSSRLHCEVLYRNAGFVLRDNNSTNGTLCNQTRIDEHPLEFGDVIQVADTVMEFTSEGYELKDSDPAAAIAAFEKCLEREPNFLLALRNLAFLLERDVRRKREAEPLWKRIAQIEQSR